MSWRDALLLACTARRCARVAVSRVAIWRRRSSRTDRAPRIGDPLTPGLCPRILEFGAVAPGTAAPDAAVAVGGARSLRRRPAPDTRARTQIPPLLQQGGDTAAGARSRNRWSVSNTCVRSCGANAHGNGRRDERARHETGADKPRHELLGTPEPGQRCQRFHGRSHSSSAFDPVQGDLQQLGGFFLDIEDRLRLLEPLPQPGVLFAQLLVLEVTGSRPRGPVAWPVPSATLIAERAAIPSGARNTAPRGVATLHLARLLAPICLFQIPSLYGTELLATFSGHGSGRDAAVIMVWPSSPVSPVDEDHLTRRRLAF